MMYQTCFYGILYVVDKFAKASSRCNEYIVHVISVLYNLYFKRVYNVQSACNYITTGISLATLIYSNGYLK